MAEDRKRCPHCAERVPVDARLCRYCRHEFTPASIATATNAALFSRLFVLGLALVVLVAMVRSCAGPATSIASVESPSLTPGTSSMTNAIGNQLHAGGAPAGDPVIVARQFFRTSPQKCGRVRTAIRLGDDSVRAICSNDETYRIFTIDGASKPIAMRCAAAAGLGVSGC